jgi:uncharacterized protein DUF1553/uncharacterized protein DUF1549
MPVRAIGRIFVCVTLVAALSAADSLRAATGEKDNPRPATAKSSQRASTKKGAATLPNVELHRPRVPAALPGSGLSNPVDLLLQAHLKSVGADLLHPVSDGVFARRVYLDLIGLLPPAAELEAFRADTHPHKRKRLVRQLLERREDYAVHWLAFWNDLLRNEYRGTGFIDDGRRQITRWLFRGLYDNERYDRFVHELVSPVPGSEGFVKGIEWRGVVNASQRREMQAAQTTAQVFLGTNLKCASCHDSFTNQWTLADSHGMAAVFADGPFSIYRCDKATGDHARAKFLFPEVGPIDSNAPRAERMKQLADRITDPKNGRLPKTVVNRYWARLLGRGLIDPLDNMEKEAWNPELLDWLAADFVDHGYDLKHLLETICTSRTYQLPSVGEPRPEETASAFRGPLVRRMTAEQFIDAVSEVTGIWPRPTRDLLKVDGRGQGGQVGVVSDVLNPKPAATIKQADAKETEPPPPAIRVRAALAMDNALSRALGRPNREQVVTRRDSLATMLQALELVNGTTLDSVLNRGGRQWIEQGHADSGKIVERAYRTALGRLPSESERKTLVEVVGAPASPEGIHDLLWTVVMLPEFQLIE